MLSSLLGIFGFDRSKSTIFDVYVAQACSIFDEYSLFKGSILAYSGLKVIESGIFFTETSQYYLGNVWSSYRHSCQT